MMKIHKHVCPRPNIGDEINDWFWLETLGVDLDIKLVDTLLVGIGTVLSNKLPKGMVKHVLGSGTGYNNDGFTLDDEYVVHFVRGPLTAEKLKLPVSKWITDPAILISELRPFAAHRDIPISFMPHVGIDSEEYRLLIENLGWNYISPSADENLVLSQIARSEKLITSAMHGAIFADSYRTPWFPVVTSDEILDFKWKDWTLSMDLKYTPVRLPAYWGRGKSVVSRLKALIKKRMIKKALKKIYLNKDFNISADSIFISKVRDMKKCLNDFKREYL